MMPENGKNDYDRIAKNLRGIISTVWNTQKSLENEEYWGKALAPYALDSCVRRMNGLAEWVEGLAKSHRKYSNESEKKTDV